MILLSLIAVGLLSLSSTQLRSSQATQARQEAQANARLALQIAIGNLQKYAGPDQRITATADMAGTAEGDALPSGSGPENNTSLDGTQKGLTSVQPGTRHWTGVFTNNDDPSEIYEKTPSASLLRWLVSSPADGLGSGDVNPGNSAYQVGGNQSSAQAVLLVGNNTPGNEIGSDDSLVSAPLVSIRNPETGNPQGAFAWWVGDEGVKSRLNLQNEDELDIDYDTFTAQRRGWETVTGMEGYPTPGGGSNTDLTRILTLPTAKLIPGASGGTSSGSANSLFHSATTVSRGLLTNPLEGGLKVDLTTAFAQGLSSGPPAGAYDNYPTRDGRVIPGTASSALARLEHLTWDHLLEFTERHRSLGSNGLQVRGKGEVDEASISPAIIDIRLVLGVKMETNGRRVTADSDFQVIPAGKLAVTLANPYSVPLVWESGLELQLINQTPLGNRPARLWQYNNNNCAYFPADETPRRAGREVAVFNQAVFTIEPGRLEPGEARGYTQAEPLVRTIRTASREVTIPFKPIDATNINDFNNSVQLESGVSTKLPKSLDVRESWQTTLVMLEMRLAGSSRGEFLRRVERLELDNGYYWPTTRQFTFGNYSQFSGGPVPLVSHTLQLSQPGIDYLRAGRMPRDYEMGQRGSTLRTFMDFNLHGTNFSKPIASYNPPPFFMEMVDSWAGLAFDGGFTGDAFAQDMAFNPIPWGFSNVEGPRNTILYSVPERFSTLAQFQHADLTNDAERLSIGHQPAYALGNSYATPFVQRELVNERRVDYEIMGSNNHSGATQMPREYYDISHILNSSLYDRYYFSTLDLQSREPRNPNYVLTERSETANFSEPSEVAKSLQVEGAFNVNSTSIDAWKALLGSTRFRQHPTSGQQSGNAAFPRSLEQTAQPITPPTGSGEDSFAGYRELDEQEVDALAREITRQVRKRGPFVSLSHFVNRAVAPLEEAPELTRSGALQCALDESGVNISIDGDRNGFQDISASKDRVTLAHKNRAPRADVDGGDTSNQLPNANRRHPDWAVTSADNNYGAVASILADSDMLYDREFRPEQGYRSTGIPGWMLQGDMLQVLEPSLTVRSDTFRIRSCGRSYDAAGKILATAYAEAIVQRQVDYLDPSNEPESPYNELNSVNERFGRRFQVIAFRWLSENEI
ncbi:hypothetical protein [Roseibacillus ishigakijimensis]|uniref:Verru_Chthon cassette protein A n=1 Tax=Roseibacillus ishigakijimensis TaxID=454146 RepID=A0A934RS45_9BACT|nr:hypothetical protein [Roseibacillus ishigakijimensis]MBK1834641.1 hypothetical protein [Roseibacillus ishigakijimensis]